jgi:DNA-binding PadR family transcriptional regulator
MHLDVLNVRGSGWEGRMAADSDRQPASRHDADGDASGASRCCGGRRGPGRGGLVEPALLTVLASGRSHGYAIAQDVEELTGGKVCLDPGGVYRTLRRLEAEGCVVSDWDDGEAGPKRRSYRITDEGRGLLEWWVGDVRGRARALGQIADAAEAALGGEE